MVDDRTKNMGLPLSHADNTLDQDLPRLRESFETIDSEMHAVMAKIKDVSPDIYKAFISAATKDGMAQHGADPLAHAMEIEKAVNKRGELCEAAAQAAYKSHADSPDAHAGLFKAQADLFGANGEKITALSEEMGAKLNKADYSGYPSRSYIDVPWTGGATGDPWMKYTAPSDGLVYFFANAATTTNGYMFISCDGIYQQSFSAVRPNMNYGVSLIVFAGAKTTIGGYYLTNMAVRFLPAKKAS